MPFRVSENEAEDDDQPGPSSERKIKSSAKQKLNRYQRFQINPKHWAKLGEWATPVLRDLPTFSFLFGSFDPVQIEQQKKISQRKPRDPKQTGPAAVLKKIEHEEESQELEHTAFAVKLIYFSLVAYTGSMFIFILFFIFYFINLFGLNFLGKVF